jgi:hypothetical protein
VSDGVTRRRWRLHVKQEFEMRKAFTLALGAAVLAAFTGAASAKPQSCSQKFEGCRNTTAGSKASAAHSQLVTLTCNRKLMQCLHAGSLGKSTAVGAAALGIYTQELGAALGQWHGPGWHPELPALSRDP